MTKVSFELIPPQTKEGISQLLKTTRDLQTFAPRYFSLAYGAGGNIQSCTSEALQALQHKNYRVASHLSCIGATRAKITTLLEKYQHSGIRKLLVLRGDLPAGTKTVAGEFRYAKDLVAFIRKTTGNTFKLGVAAYPEGHPTACSFEQDLYYFKQKVEAGADFAVTQYFYDPQVYFNLRDTCEKLNINIPIVPGIMPIYNFSQLLRFSVRCGVNIPSFICQRMSTFKEDNQAMQDFGVEVLTELCKVLKENGVAHLHFFTLNQSRIVTRILKNLQESP